MTRRLAWVLLAVLAAYAVFIGGSWWGIYNPTLRLISVVLAAIVLGAWLVVSVRDPSWRPRSMLLPAIGACLASLAISTLFSRFQGISLEYLAYAVVLAALYMLLVQLLTREFFRARFVALCGALLMATVGAYFALTVSHWIHWLDVLGRATIPPLRPEFESLTLGNPSTVLTLVALLAVPVVGSVSWTSRRGLAAAVGALALVAAVALVSGSRAGWLALAIAGGVAVVGGLIAPSGRRAVRSVVVRWTASPRGRALLIGVVVIAVIGAVAITPVVIKRAGAGGEANRIAFVRIALDLFKESPIVGTGLGSWVIQRPGLTLPTEPDEYIPHAHNVYAQTLAEQGVVGAIAGIILIIFLVRLLLTAVRDPDVARRRMGWAVFIGLVYFGAHQLLDFYPNFPSVLLVAAIPMALLDAGAMRAPAGPTTRPHSLGQLRTWGAAGAVGIAIVMLGLQELPAMDAARAVERANVGDWPAADAPARAAAAADPRIASYLFTAGLTADHAGDHETAANYFLDVTAANDLPEAWLNFAAEQAQLGDRAGATDSLRAALRIGRQRPAISIAAGDLALRIGENDLALDAFTSAVITAPSVLGDPWWGGEPGRTAMQAGVTKAALAATGPEIQWEIALMSGDTERARALAATPGFDPATIDFVDAWAGDAAAYARLSSQCIARPLELQLLFWCARIEGRRGNVDRANDYRYLANAINGGAYRSGAELRISANTPVGRSLEGNPAIFWGTYTYRRPTPWDILVPSLVHLGIE